MKRVTLVAASRHSRTVSTGGTACHSGPRGLVYQVSTQRSQNAKSRPRSIRYRAHVEANRP